MSISYEEWIPVRTNMIPKQKYTAQVSNGEQDGLVILLTGTEYKVKIDFGAVQAVQMLDEGTNLMTSPGCIQGTSIALAREQQFPNTIYEAYNAPFSQYIRACMGDELYDALKLRQFNVITENYVISVITPWKPEITVGLLEDGSVSPAKESANLPQKGDSL